VVVAKRALGIAQRRQHGLLIGQRGLSLGRLACPNFGSHTATVEQAPGNQRQDGKNASWMHRTNRPY
jgi:hypothetical protein